MMEKIKNNNKFLPAHAMRSHGEVKVDTDQPLTSKEAGKWSGSRAGRFIHGEGLPVHIK